MSSVLLSAAGFYEQGRDLLETVGGRLSALGHARALVLHGRTAWAKAGARLARGLNAAGVAFDAREYRGYCTAADIGQYAAEAARAPYDCVLGVGGGKLMDFSKAVADALHLPVYTVPTIAATCAACAPLSVIYTAAGSQESIRFHRSAVAGTWADLDVLAGAPTRYLCAGIADAFAKSCEYSSTRANVACGDLELGMYMGWRLACAVDDTLLLRARQAIAENAAGTPEAAFAETVACVLLFIGTVSGMGGFGGRQNARFRIAHGYNEIIRGQYVTDPRRWLHGEIVAVGVLAQLRLNGGDPARYAAVQALFEDMGVPRTLSDLGMALTDTELAAFTDHLLRHTRTAPDAEAATRRAVGEGR